MTSKTLSFVYLFGKMSKVMSLPVVFSWCKRRWPVLKKESIVYAMRVLFACIQVINSFIVELDEIRAQKIICLMIF